MRIISDGIIPGGIIPDGTPPVIEQNDFGFDSFLYRGLKLRVTIYDPIFSINPSHECAKDFLILPSRRGIK